jgi:hypothetical protein
MKAPIRRLLAFTAMSGLAVSLAACGQSATQQQQSAAAVAAPAEQPGWSMSDLAQVDPSDLNAGPAALPLAGPMTTSAPASYQQAPSVDYSGADDVAYAPSAAPDDYQYLGMAAGLTGMLGEAPPDYGFDYGGVRPWVWQTADHYYRYAEPVSGGYRYYYYQPNAARPFLISDPHYSYGYRDGQLVTIYDRSGRLIDARRAARERQAAQNYYARAAELYQAAHRERRYGVAASLWQQHRDEVAREQRQWDDARRQRQAWQQWDARNDRNLQRDWASEAVVRRHAETSFAGWQKADFRTPAPRFYSDQQRQAQLRQLAAIRQQQQAQRVRLADKAADQRVTQQQQQAEAQKLAQQRQALAVQKHRQQAQQAKLQTQRQQQLAHANTIAQQKAAAVQARQAAAQKAQQAKLEAQKAQQAKADAARQAARAAADKRKADQARLAAEQNAKRVAASKQAAEQKAKQAAADRKVAEQKARQAAADKQAAAQKAKQAAADKQAAAQKAKQAAAAKHAAAAKLAAAQKAKQEAAAKQTGKDRAAQAHAAHQARKAADKKADETKDSGQG